MTFSWDFLHPPFAYIKICIYNARVPVRNQVSIKLIIMKTRIILKIKIE